MAGFDVVRDANRLKASIGLAGQEVAIDEYLTGRENHEMIGVSITCQQGTPATARQRVSGGPSLFFLAVQSRVQVVEGHFERALAGRGVAGEPEDCSCHSAE